MSDKKLDWVDVVSTILVTCLFILLEAQILVWAWPSLTEVLTGVARSITWTQSFWTLAGLNLLGSALFKRSKQ